MPFFGTGMKTHFFQSCGHCWVFQICWHIECSTFTASSFKIWNSSTGIPSPPPALFVVMLPKAHLTSHSKMSGSRWVWVITPSRLSGSLSSFVYSCSVYSFHLLNIFCFSQVQFSSVAQSCPTLCNPMNYSMPGFQSFTISWSLLKLMSIESVMPSNHLILCHPLLLPPSIFPNIRVFSNEWVLRIRW